MPERFALFTNGLQCVYEHKDKQRARQRDFRELVTNIMISFTNFEPGNTPLGTCDALLTVSHCLESALDKGWESRLVQLGVAFDRVTHVGLLFMLTSIGVGGRILSILQQFLWNRKQRFVGDGKLTESVGMVSGVPQRSVFGPLLFVIYTMDMFKVASNRLVTYADDSALFTTIPHSTHRTAITEFLNADLAPIN